MSGSTFQISAEGGLIEVHADGSTTRIQPLLGPRAPIQTEVAAPVAAAPKASKARSTREIVRELKSRLSQVRLDIRARKELEKERDQLVRLIDAATGKRLAPVRELKRSTG